MSETYEFRSPKGRKYRITFDRTPTQADFERAIAQIRSTERVDALTELVTGITPTMKAGAKSAAKPPTRQVARAPIDLNQTIFRQPTRAQSKPDSNLQDIVNRYLTPDSRTQAQRMKELRAGVIAEQKRPKPKKELPSLRAPTEEELAAQGERGHAAMEQFYAQEYRDMDFGELYRIASGGDDRPGMPPPQSEEGIVRRRAATNVLAERMSPDVPILGNIIGYLASLPQQLGSELATLTAPNEATTTKERLGASANTLLQVLPIEAITAGLSKPAVAAVKRTAGKAIAPVAKAIQGAKPVGRGFADIAQAIAEETRKRDHLLDLENIFGNRSLNITKVIDPTAPPTGPIPEVLIDIGNARSVHKLGIKTGSETELEAIGREAAAIRNANPDLPEEEVLRLAQQYAKGRGFADIAEAISKTSKEPWTMLERKTRKGKPWFEARDESGTVIGQGPTREAANVEARKKYQSPEVKAQVLQAQRLARQELERSWQAEDMERETLIAMWRKAIPIDDVYFAKVDSGPDWGRGYDGYSQSVNASAARARGAKTPRELAIELGKAHPALKGLTAADLEELLPFVEHHTSKYYKRTKFIERGEVGEHLPELVQRAAENQDLAALMKEAKKLGITHITDESGKPLYKIGDDYTTDTATKAARLRDTLQRHTGKEYPHKAYPTVFDVQGEYGAWEKSERATGFDPATLLELARRRKAQAPAVQGSQEVRSKAQRLGNATGLARQFEDPERIARGLEPTKAPAASAESLADEGLAAMQRDPSKLPYLMGKVIGGTWEPNPQDISVLAAHKRQLYNRRAEIRDALAVTADPKDQLQLLTEYSNYDDALEHISRAAQLARTKWHDLGESLQIAWNEDFGFESLKERGRMLNLGKDLNAQQLDNLKDAGGKWEAASANMQKARTKLANNLGTLRTGRSPRVAKPPTERIQLALKRLNKLGIPTRVEGSAEAGAAASKQVGAIFVPPSDMTKIAREVRALARSYMDDGATSLDDILTRFKNDIPAISEEQALSFLSGEYRKALLEFNQARSMAQRQLNGIKRAAQWRIKGISSKAMSIAGDVINGGARALQTSMDFSAALLQGRKGLFIRPGSWFKAWGDAFRAIGWTPAKTEAKMLKLQAEMEQHPIYAIARGAGLSLTDMGGALSAQEELFRSKVGKYVPGIVQSEAAYTAFLNKLRFDLFRKLARAAPNDAAYLRDIAQMINIATGRGHGKVANILGSDVAGAIFYAPRYAWSGVQYAALTPLTKATTARGRKEALKMYGAQLTSYIALTLLAKEFGWDVETDLRSTDFGMVRMPNGHQFDLFGKEAEPLRLAARLLYGSVSKKGEYTKNTAFGAESFGDIMERKFAPWAGALNMARTGQVYDSRIGTRRDIEGWQDVASQYLPLSIQDIAALPNKDLWSVILAILGGRVQPTMLRDTPKNPAPPFPPQEKFNQLFAKPPKQWLQELVHSARR